MNKRHRLRNFLGRSRNPSPPPATFTSSASSSTPASPGEVPSSDRNVATSLTGISGLTANATSPNQALQRAIEKQIAKIPDAEKDAFRAMAQQMTDECVLKQVESYDMDHRSSSAFRPHAEPLSRFLGLLNRFMDAIAVGIQANPDLSAIVVGVARGVISVAIQFVGFFDKLTTMIGRMSDYLVPLAAYSKTSSEFDDIKYCLVNMYSDILRFFCHARRVFVNDRGAVRKWTSWRVFWRIHWIPFEDEFGQIEADMEHHREVLGNTAMAKDLFHSLEASRAELARHKRERDREREDFLRWLSNHPFEDDHRKMYDKKHPGTGDWLLQRPEFETWFAAQRSGFLWCYGKPGAGKSVLTSNVIEYVTSQRALDKDVGIAFVYYNYDIRDMKDESFVIIALIKQLCRQLCRKNEDVSPGFLKVKQDALPPSQLGNFDSFSTTACQFSEVFIIIDALDECPQDNRPKILKFLRDVTSRIPRMKVFVTSRREIDIEEAFQEIDTPRIMIEARTVEEDITRYVRDEVRRLRAGQDGQKLHLRSDELESKIVTTLTRKADGMFLWVKLQLENLCRVSASRRDKEVEKALDTLPKDLDETYDRCLKQIDQQVDYNRDLAFRTLRWVVYAQRPLTVEELRHALAAEEMTNLMADSELDDLDVILSACANLLEVTDIDRWSQIVRPIHYSVKEFITLTWNVHVQGRLLNAQHEMYQIQALLSETCISYLQSTLITAKPCENSYLLRARLEQHPFLWYAARSFDIHLTQSSSQKEAIQLTINMLQQPGSFLSSMLQVRRVSHELGVSQTPDPYKDFDPFTRAVDATMVIFSTRLYDLQEFNTYWNTAQLPATLLHSACSAGLTKAVSHLLHTGCKADAEDSNGTRPLYHAASAGYADIVEILLDNHAHVTAQGGYYGNALQGASAEGYEKVVQMLLDKGADVNAQGGFYGNALQAASSGGHEKVVQMLLDKGADVNAQGGFYGNALQTASTEGHEKVVQMLLDKGADVNAQGGHYGNALQAASSGGHEKVIQMLLDKGADVNAQGRFYGNALQAASSGGHEKVVQMILDKGADVNAQGGYYGNALQAAATGGHEKVVQMLLDKGADVNAQGGYYGNALQAASSGGHEKVVQMILDKGADVNAQGGYYGNALQAASSGGHEKVIQMILDKGADVNAQGGFYGNALQAASIRGHEKVVQMILDKGADVNAQGGHYGNALQAASSGGHEKVIQMLLDKGADVNAQGGYYGNALQAASSEGHEKVVQMLLDKGADVNAQGRFYGNALQAASSGGHEKVVQMILDKGADVNAQGGYYGNALQAASSGGHEKVVQMILDKGADDTRQWSR
ncbi:hypothetical protein GJ744_002176 [Endocarpon pusillum]|uniref:NACHT domain-containing protein n=1 Tax=Endocarpon pusillum TaxID=364733 RepID=A0A8H7ACA8_9EURO|nr:hypothetical protein GJ744_002176 [Endocarpon pusillum]